jgi:hypothetical protein
MDNPDISGEEYQHGTLFGYELREYLMEYYRHTCQYCGGKSEDSVLEWEHIIPKSRGGSDSVRNATLSCCSCNRDKGALTPNEWLKQLKEKTPGCKKDGELTQTRITHLESILSNGKVYEATDMPHGAIYSESMKRKRYLKSLVMLNARQVEEQNTIEK